jgi:hypothetical protein
VYQFTIYEPKGFLPEMLSNGVEKENVQSTQYRTNPEFEWSILPGTGHLNTGPFKNQTFPFGFRMVASLDCFVKKRVFKKYFIHYKTI